MRWESLLKLFYISISIKINLLLDCDYEMVMMIQPCLSTMNYDKLLLVFLDKNAYFLGSGCLIRWECSLFLKYSL